MALKRAGKVAEGVFGLILVGYWVIAAIAYIGLAIFVRPAGLGEYACGALLVFGLPLYYTVEFFLSRGLS